MEQCKVTILCCVRWCNHRSETKNHIYAIENSAVCMILPNMIASGYKTYRKDVTLLADWLINKVMMNMMRYHLLLLLLLLLVSYDLFLVFSPLHESVGRSRSFVLYCCIAWSAKTRKSHDCELTNFEKMFPNENREYPGEIARCDFTHI